jgi:hypothetical protein
MPDEINEDQMDGLKIREFFSQLFGSRRAEDLRLTNLQLREDFDQRLRDKDAIILDLRSEIQRCREKLDRYEMVLIPLANPTHKEPDFEPFVSDNSWEKTQEDWYRQQDIEAAAQELAAKQEQA